MVCADFIVCFSCPRETLCRHGYPASSHTPSRWIRTARIDLEGTNGKILSTVTDSSVSGAVLSISCALPSSSNWAGADILAGTFGAADFETAQTVTIALRNPGTTNDFSIFLQLGVYDSESFEDNATIRTWQLPTPVAGGGWKTQSIQLTDFDRRALTAGKEMRLIVIPSSTASPSQTNPLRVKLYSGTARNSRYRFRNRHKRDQGDRNVKSRRQLKC